MATYYAKPPYPVFNPSRLLAKGLIGYWWLGDVSAFDFAQQQHPLTVEGEPQLIASPYSRSLAFNGSTDRIYTRNKGVQGTGARTAVVLFRQHETGGGDKNLIGWGDSDGTNIGTSWRVTCEGGDIYLRVYAGMTYWPSTCNDGRWHLAVIHCPDNATLADHRCWVDGVDLGPGSGTRAIDTTAGSGTYRNVTLCGSVQLSDYDYFTHADLSMAAVWNRELTPLEVRLLTMDPFAVVRPDRSLLDRFSLMVAAPEADPISATWFGTNW